MFRIGLFARLCQVSIATLRHYDELGLLKPEQVDHFTGYSYYTAEQMPRLQRILAFKEMGLSLEHITPLLDANLSRTAEKSCPCLTSGRFQAYTLFRFH